MTEAEAKAKVVRLFELLDIVEETDDGRRFRPNVISSCRALDGVVIADLLVELKNWAVD